MSLNDDEKADWRERFLAEAAQEHERRMGRSEAKKQEQNKVARTNSAREELEREAEIARLRLEVREAFWIQQGYVAYVDSRGTRLWLTPDEYEERMSRRKRKKKPGMPKLAMPEIPQRVVLVAVVLGLAVVVGLFVGGL